MKIDNFTLPLGLNDELIIDNFAGGGGTSTGIEAAIGRPVDIAINHDPEALAMHAANHPHTAHYCESVWDIDPREVTKNQPVGLVWLSPDCKHFSKAKGGKPVEKKIRGLAWVALRWAAVTRPRVIILENVEEFVTWGPLVEDAEGNMRPCPKRKGQTFESFKRALARQGYQVEHRELRACDYGAPTIRKRFFMIARRDGLPICWPVPTHGNPKSKEVKSGKLLPWRTAAECIDWSIPCPSIFERKKPLAEATLRRIAKGIMRYIVNSDDPFIVPSFVTECANATSQRNMNINDPLRTQCAQVKGGHFALVAPTLVQTGYGEREGQSPRAPGLDKPLGTVVAGGAKHALVSALLTHYHSDKSSTEVRASNPSEPLKTQTTENRHALVTASITKFRTGAIGSSCDEPIHTITAGGESKRPAGSPHAMGIITSNLVKMRGTNIGQDNRDPIHTISAQGTHFAEVRAFLIKYYGNEKEALDITGPLHTITARDRYGLVTIKGQEYDITDIGLRMLAPRELYRAQGFPDDYIIGDNADQGLTLTKSAQVRMCGNSVPPPLSQSLVAANFVHEIQIARIA